MKTYDFKSYIILINVKLRRFNFIALYTNYISVNTTNEYFLKKEINQILILKHIVTDFHWFLAFIG